jgi:hypothetical protein
MPLVKLQDGPSQWTHVKDAAHILWQASNHSDINALRGTLCQHYSNSSLTAVALHTGINTNRKAVLVSSNETITLAFDGSGPDELIMNTWTMAKGPYAWNIPYPVYNDDGNRVHRFYRDMWYGVRAATFDALSKAVKDIVARGVAPERVVVAGFSMGGGVST